MSDSRPKHDRVSYALVFHFPKAMDAAFEVGFVKGSSSPLGDDLPTPHPAVVTE